MKKKITHIGRYQNTKWNWNKVESAQCSMLISDEIEIKNVLYYWAKYPVLSIYNKCDMHGIPQWKNSKLVDGCIQTIWSDPKCKLCCYLVLCFNWIYHSVWCSVCYSISSFHLWKNESIRECRQMRFIFVSLFLLQLFIRM